jgi:hydrogenase/urease accessory protein HupE
MSRIPPAVLGLPLLLASGISVQAHTSLPGYLELTEVGAGSFGVLWRVPAVDGPPPAIYPVFPSHCAIPSDPSGESAVTSIVARGVIVCGPKGLAGHRIEIRGLRLTIMDVVVRVAFADGTGLTHVLRPQEPAFEVRRDPGRARVDAAGYLRLGVDHILSGVDHLLFVFGLLLIIAGWRRLLKAVSAFTLAHSITLGLAAFGIVRLPATPIEAVVALSIVFLAVELAQHERGLVGGLSYRRPWLVAFAFGLLHGFGFAGTLSDIGIPSGDIPLALLFFNLGVEIGQVGFIAGCLALFYSLGTLEIRFPLWMRRVPAYTVGSFASFWFLQRCTTIFAP